MEEQISHTIRLFLFQLKERTVSYVRIFLREPDDGFSHEEKEVRKVVEEFLKNVEDQKLDNSDSDYFSLVRFYVGCTKLSHKTEICFVLFAARTGVEKTRSQ